MRRLIVLAIPVLVLFACGDKGAVKETTPPAAAPETSAPATAPPLASTRAGGETQLPPGHPPIGTNASGSMAIPPPPAGSGTGSSGLTWTTPAGWVEETPSSSMRRAQYRVPGPGGDAECAVFYFGPGQGGEPLANAKRWAGQFKDPAGGAAAMRTIDATVGDLGVLLVDVKGTYNGGMTMTAEPAKPEPGYALAGAIVQGPDANWFFKLTGPEATVKAQHDAFLALVKSLKRGA